jgi:response regulator RpfG family c-di-GMP phosphodiesterase
MDTSLRPRVICVDDEPHVASGLALHLRRRYEVEIATSGQAGLELLARKPEAAVVISDMRMPNMNGAEFLARASLAYPSTTRVLLTGYAELESAVRAINEGHVFRFLVKPCPPPELVRTIDAAAEQHRLLLAEQVLLEQTLHGSVKMLTEVLAITNPVAFGRAVRIKSHVSRLAEKLNEKERWQVELAAMLSQLGTITLPNETNERLYYGATLSEAEPQMVERAPDVTDQLLRHIPRLGTVREILGAQSQPRRAHAAAELSGEERVVRRGAQLLKVASDFDALEAQGLSAQHALEALKGRASEYDPEVLAAMLDMGGGRAGGETIRDISLAALKPGMVFAADVKLTTGTLFVARGYEVTESFLERLKNFRAGSVKEPVKVVLRAAPSSATP